MHKVKGFPSIKVSLYKGFSVQGSSIQYTKVPVTSVLVYEGSTVYKGFLSSEHRFQCIRIPGYKEFYYMKCSKCMLKHHKRLAKSCPSSAIIFIYDNLGFPGYLGQYSRISP